MSGDDDRRRPPGPTRQFGVLPTEVLKGPATRVDPGATTRPREAPRDPFSDPATEVLGPGAVDPVRQAIARAAQEPTAFDLQFDDVDVPRPISGMAPDGFSGEVTADEGHLPFAEPPLGSESGDAFPVSDETELHPGWQQPSLDDIGNAFDRALSGSFDAPPPPPSSVPFPPAPSSSSDGGLLSDLGPPGLPELSFPGLPPPAAPDLQDLLEPDEPLELAPPNKRGLFGVVLLLVLLVVASAAGVGAYLHFVEGVPLPFLAAQERSPEPAIAAAQTPPPSTESAAEPAAAEPAAGADSASAGDGPEAEAEALAAAPADAPGAREEEAEPAAPEISPKWKSKTVYVGIAGARDKSKSKVARLERTLKEGFGRALKQDGHAKWKVKNRRVSRGHVLYLDVIDVDVQPREGGYSAEVSCRATAYKKPGSQKLVRDAKATASVDGAPSRVLRAQLIRDATRSCSVGLSTDFIGAALR